MAKESIKENKNNTKSTKKVAKTTSKKNNKTSKTKETTSKKGTSINSTKKSTSVKSTKKVSTKSKSVKKTSPNNSKKTSKQMLAEYYDLPYGYNETAVKILAQTPTTLFVYWDISEADRNSLINKYGDNFFYDTRPILIVHNITKSYSFEVEINDFANSWYIRCQEPNCDYIVELGRKIIDKPDQYIYIDSSNDAFSPNDHILFEKADFGHIVFRNAKTGVLTSKDFGSLRFMNDIDKLYGSVYDVYNKLYGVDALNELSNPSSGEFIIK